MTDCATDVPIEPAATRSIRKAVEAILTSYGRGLRRVPRRNHYRITTDDHRLAERDPTDLPFYLSPLFECEAGFACGADAPIIAVTRDLSPRGIGFRCDLPLPISLMLAEFDCDQTGQILLLIEIRWCRRQSSHSYLAGGRIVRVLNDEELFGNRPFRK